MYRVLSHGEARKEVPMTTELIKPAELAKRIEKSEAVLANWRYLGLGPKFVKVGARSIRYRVSDIEDWLNQQTRQQTGAA